MGDMTGYRNPLQAADPEITLHVEGPTDKQVIEDRWLAHSRALRGRVFSAVEAATDDRGERSRSHGSAGGAKEVVKRLEAALNDTGTIAMGLVDRDYLLQRDTLNAMLEVDDARFGAQVAAALPKELVERLWVLPRWELENYLLTGLEDLRQELEDRPKRAPPKTVEELANRLLDLAQVNRPLVLAMLWCTGNGHDHIKVKGQDLIGDASEMRAAVIAAPEAPSDDDLAPFETRVAAFETGGTVAERWDTASRLVDGKWMLKRISRDWSSNKSADLRRGLASRAAERNNGPPAEIALLLDKMRRSARELANQQGSP